MACPSWLVKRLKESGGLVSFHNYMDWSLNDPIHGAYSSGQLSIGRHGDFVTSPSLGNEFAELLVVQILDWFFEVTLKNF